MMQISMPALGQARKVGDVRCTSANTQLPTQELCPPKAANGQYQKSADTHETLEIRPIVVPERTRIEDYIDSRCTEFHHCDKPVQL